MSTTDTSKFYKGMRIIFENALWEIVDFQHRVMQARKPVVKTKLKNIISGLTQEKSFRSGDTFSLPDLLKKSSQYLYSNKEVYTFMDLDSYEQYELDNKVVGDKAAFMKEDLNVQLLHYAGEIIDIELPTSVELKIQSTEPGLKGDTVTGGTKPAELETGADITVPLFINIDDVIKVDTRDGKYLERTKKA